MKDWKEQLQKIKHTLRNRDENSSDNCCDKPARIDFDPPASWLNQPMNQERKTPKSNADSSKATPRPAAQSQSSSGKNINNAGLLIKKARKPSAIAKPSPPVIQAKHTCREPEQKPDIQVYQKKTLKFRPRIDIARELSLPDWAKCGKALQPPDVRLNRQHRHSIQIRLGIDFGTAFTKVALRVGPDLVAVDWSAVSGNYSPVGRWIVPGLVCRGANKEYGLRPIAAGEWLTNLKLPLVEDSLMTSCPCSALAFLAETIRYSRAFLFHHPNVSSKLANRNLRWEMNIGCPTRPHENPDIQNRLKKLALTAWWLSGQDELNELVIRRAWDKQTLDTGLETEPGVIPEFVAQIAGYLRSPQVNEGLHSIVDVGAATLDVATFNVVLPRDDNSVPKIPIFFSAVKHLGTHFLMQRRHESLELVQSWDDAAPVMDAVHFAEHHGKSVLTVREIDHKFAHNVAHAIFLVIDGTRTNDRGNPYSPAWKEGLPMFIAGGGSACDVYRYALNICESSVKSHMEQSGKFRFINMDVAGGKSFNINSIAAQRLLVTFGLTEDTEEIARIVPHCNIKPIEYKESTFISHEYLYSD